MAAFAMHNTSTSNMCFKGIDCHVARIYNSDNSAWPTVPQTTIYTQGIQYMSRQICSHETISKMQEHLGTRGEYINLKATF